MWSLELHIKQVTTAEKEYYTFWHKVESVEITSEERQWEIIAEWRESYALQNMRGLHFICLSRFSEVIDDFKEEEINYKINYGTH